MIRVFAWHFVSSQGALASSGRQHKSNILIILCKKNAQTRLQECTSYYVYLVCSFHICVQVFLSVAVNAYLYPAPPGKLSVGGVLLQVTVRPSVRDVLLVEDILCHADWHTFYLTLQPLVSKWTLSSLNSDESTVANRGSVKLNLGPVVQSVISVKSSLVVKMFTVLVSTISNSHVFLQSYSHFLQQKY